MFQTHSVRGAVSLPTFRRNYSSFFFFNCHSIYTCSDVTPVCRAGRCGSGRGLIRGMRDVGAPGGRLAPGVCVRDRDRHGRERRGQEDRGVGRGEAEADPGAAGGPPPAPDPPADPGHSLRPEPVLRGPGADRDPGRRSFGRRGSPPPPGGGGGRPSLRGPAAVQEETGPSVCGTGLSAPQESPTGAG